MSVMKVRCSTATISALIFSLCLVTSLPWALSSASTWNEVTIKLPYGAVWNFFAPLGFAYLGIVAIGLIVLWTGYRRRERWAWFVLLIVLLFFYLPSFVLPMLLQMGPGDFQWSYLLGFLGVFSDGGWRCLATPPSPFRSVRFECSAVQTAIEPLRFLVMWIALLLPIKAFFWRAAPASHQGVPSRLAALWRQARLVWVPSLIVCIALAVFFIVKGPIASNQNRKQIADAWRPYSMVFVDLAKAENVVPMPDVAMEDTIVVAVTRDGAVFLGRDKVEPASLGNSIRAVRTNKTGETMYLRADRRAQYRDVENAIGAMRSAGAEVIGLVTKRKEDPEYARPESFLWVGNPLLKSVGLEVSFNSAPKVLANGLRPQNSTIVVHVISHAKAAPDYKINAADVAHADLQSQLTDSLAGRAERILFIKGDDDLNFSDIADVIDIGKGSKADHVVLKAPGDATSD